MPCFVFLTIPCVLLDYFIGYGLATLSETTKVLD